MLSYGACLSLSRPPHMSPDGSIGVTGVNGAQVHIYGMITARVNVGTWTGSHTFMVSDVPRNAGVLGLDFINTHCSSVDVVKGYLTFVEEPAKVEFVPRTKQSQTARVSLVQHITILPGISFLQARVEPGKLPTFKGCSLGIVEGCNQQLVKDGVVLAAAAVRPGCETVPVTLANVTDKALFIKKVLLLEYCGQLVQPPLSSLPCMTIN